MKVKWIGRAVAVVALFSLLCVIPFSATAKTITLNMAGFVPATTFCSVGMFRYAEEIEKRTDGKVKIKTFPGGTLLGAMNMIDGVLTGQADIGDACVAYQPGRFPVANAMGLPISVPNAKTASRALWELNKKHQPAEFKDLKVLYMYTNTPGNLMSTFPIRTLDDLKGRSMRASGVAGQILKAWGANYIGMPQSDVPEALQKNVIQGLFTSLEVMLDMRYADYCKHITITEIGLFPFAVVMNQKTWNGLPKDVQKVFDDMSIEQSEWVGNYIDNHVMKSVGWSIVHQGVEAIQLSKTDRDKWLSLLEPLITAAITEWEGKGLPFQQIVNDMKQLLTQFK